MLSICGKTSGTSVIINLFVLVSTAILPCFVKTLLITFKIALLPFPEVIDEPLPFKEKPSPPGPPPDTPPPIAELSNTLKDVPEPLPKLLLVTSAGITELKSVERDVLG